MIGKRTTHFSSLEEVKQVLGDKAYAEAKAQVEARPAVTSVPGKGSLLSGAAVPDGNLECDSTGHVEIEAAVEKANSRHGLSGPFTLWVYVESHRERDVDGISAKWAVDALVKAGVIKGDDCKTIVREVKEVVVVPNSEPERTVIKLFKEEVAEHG